MLLTDPLERSPAFISALLHCSIVTSSYYTPQRRRRQFDGHVLPSHLVTWLAPSRSSRTTLGRLLSCVCDHDISSFKYRLCFTPEQRRAHCARLDNHFRHTGCLLGQTPSLHLDRPLASKLHPDRYHYQYHCAGPPTQPPCRHSIIARSYPQSLESPRLFHSRFRLLRHSSHFT